MFLINYFYNNEGKKRNTKKLSIINIFFFVFLNLYIRDLFCNEQKICKKNYNDSFEKYHLYQKCNENYCKYLKKISEYFPSQQNNQNGYSFSDKYSSLSEIQISSNFLNFKNIYLNNPNQLIFHQLGYKFVNGAKIYNFGLGYRNYYSSRWVIGNNIFQDTLLSSKNNKKILSIGNEFLKHSIHITINAYYDMSHNTPMFTKNKKYFPFFYDIHIQNFIPFFTNTQAKINLEYYCDHAHNNKNIIPHKINTQEADPVDNNNKYKLKLGLLYTPTSIFTFNINQTIFNSTKKNETTFGIVAHYSIHIPWIYPKKEKNNNIQCYNTNYKTIWSASNHKYVIHRNYSPFLLQSQNINSNNIEKKHIIQKNNKDIKTNEENNQTKKTIDSVNNLHTHEVKSSMNSILHTTSNNTNNKQCENHEIFFDESVPINSELNSQMKQISIDEMNIVHTQNIDIVNINNSELSSNISTSAVYNNEKQLLETNVNHEKSHTQITLQTSSNSQETEKQQLNQIMYIDSHNIPPPPPIFDILLKNTPSKKDESSNINSVQGNHNITNLEKIDTLDKHKNEKFFTLGSAEHLSKLNNIIQKRKKTTSTSSNDSNDSESIRLFKIIERQSILTRDNDSDSDDKESIISNDFSE